MQRLVFVRWRVRFGSIEVVRCFRRRAFRQLFRFFSFSMSDLLASGGTFFLQLLAPARSHPGIVAC